MWIKICGIKDVFSALHVYSEGGNALGFIFVPESRRFLSIEDAKKIAPFIKSIPILKIGVFQNVKRNEVGEMLKIFPLDGIQFHGEESPSFCKEFKDFFLIKAFNLDNNISLDNIKKEISKYSFCHILLDRRKDSFRISWEEFLEKAYSISKDFPIILAGGINEENLDSALSINPWGIDLSSGVENEKGEKDLEKISRFLRKVREKDETS
ncbi:MAG: phosphoribosylanthranilate isomerase [Dictyoglomaceae bacterium]